ncbi:AAA family ATPase [Dehalococcoidia bacterium]|nr:AAA family ATPase [Dehalococcoidia bacterium]
MNQNYAKFLPNIVLLLGSGGVGKTTIAEKLSKEYGYHWLDGDNADTEIFPNGGQWKKENQKKLKKAHELVLKKTNEVFKTGKRVVVDYIGFNYLKHYLDLFVDNFGKDLRIVILTADMETIIKRDKDREYWTTGKANVELVLGRLDELKNCYGESFIDTSKMSTDDVISSILNL